MKAKKSFKSDGLYTNTIPFAMLKFSIHDKIDAIMYGIHLVVV